MDKKNSIRVRELVAKVTPIFAEYNLVAVWVDESLSAKSGKVEFRFVSMDEPEARKSYGRAISLAVSKMSVDVGDYGNRQNF